MWWNTNKKEKNPEEEAEIVLRFDHTPTPGTSGYNTPTPLNNSRGSSTHTSTTSSYSVIPSDMGGVAGSQNDNSIQTSPSIDKSYNNRESRRGDSTPLGVATTDSTLINNSPPQNSRKSSTPSSPARRLLVPAGNDEEEVKIDPFQARMFERTATDFMTGKLPTLAEAVAAKEKPFNYANLAIPLVVFLTMYLGIDQIPGKKFYYETLMLSGSDDSSHYLATRYEGFMLASGLPITAGLKAVLTIAKEIAKQRVITGKNLPMPNSKAIGLMFIDLIISLGLTPPLGYLIDLIITSPQGLIIGLPLILGYVFLLEYYGMEKIFDWVGVSPKLEKQQEENEEEVPLRNNNQNNYGSEIELEQNQQHLDLEGFQEDPQEDSRCRCGIL